MNSISVKTYLEHSSNFHFVNLEPEMSPITIRDRKQTLISTENPCSMKAALIMITLNLHIPWVAFMGAFLS